MLHWMDGARILFVLGAAMLHRMGFSMFLLSLPIPGTSSLASPSTSIEAPWTDIDRARSPELTPCKGKVMQSMQRVLHILWHSFTSGSIPLTPSLQISSGPKELLAQMKLQTAGRLHLIICQGQPQDGWHTLNCGVHDRKRQAQMRMRQKWLRGVLSSIAW